MRANVFSVAVHVGAGCSAVLLSLSLGGCTTYRDELVRTQSAYEANEHEKALALARAIEPNAPHLKPEGRTRYFYLRGMTDFRIGYRGEARHHLAVARAMEVENPGALPADWKARMTETLATLNTEVYANGLASLSAHEAETSKKSKKK